MQDIDIERLVKMIKGSKFMPKYLKDAAEPDIYFTILRGKELGLQPLQSLSSLYPKDDRLTVDAAGMRALVLKAGHKINIIERGQSSCTLEGVRVSVEGEWSEKVTYTLEDARIEGVLDKPFWKKYPSSMLLARATGILVRFMFADLIQGLYGTEETDDALPTLRETEALNAFAHLQKPITGTTAPEHVVTQSGSFNEYLIKSDKFPGKNIKEPLGTWSIGSLRYALGTASVKATLTDEDINAMQVVVKEKIIESNGANESIDNIKLGE